MCAGARMPTRAAGRSFMVPPHLEDVMASTQAPPTRRSRATAPAAAAPVSTTRRHAAWLVGGMALAFLVPYVLADRIGLARDLYYGALRGGCRRRCSSGWARDTGQSLREMLARRWRLGRRRSASAFAGISAFIATRAEDAGAHPGGIEFVGALVLARASCTGRRTGCCCRRSRSCSCSPRCADSRLRRRAGGLIAVGAIAMVASLAMTAVYHAGYSDFRSEQAAQAGDRRPDLERADAGDAQSGRRADRPRRAARRRGRAQLRHATCSCRRTRAAEALAAAVLDLEHPAVVEGGQRLDDRARGR